MTTLRLVVFAAAVLTLPMMTGCDKPSPAPAHKAASSSFVAIARGKVDVDGGLVHIAPARDGIAKTVKGNIGDAVKAGDVLIVLDSTQFVFARDAAKADLATAEAQAALLRSRQGGLKVRASRAERAARVGATSDQSADDARQALAELRLEIIAAQSSVEAAKQKVRQAEYEIAARTIRAPVAGKIVSRNIRAGEAVSPLNAQAQGEWLESILDLDPAARALLGKAAEAGGLTARGWTRTLRLARTIADLEGSGGVRRTHVAEALIYRRIAPGLGTGVGFVSAG